MVSPKLQYIKSNITILHILSLTSTPDIFNRGPKYQKEKNK